MDTEQLQEIINVLNNKLAQANLQHAAAEAQVAIERRKVENLQAQLNERIETVSTDVEKKK